MLLLRSLFRRCKKLLVEPVIGGLRAPCRNFFALEPEDGVDGGRLAENGVSGPAVDDGVGKPALRAVPDMVMLRPPHLGHLRCSESKEFAGEEAKERLLFLPFRRG